MWLGWHCGTLVLHSARLQAHDQGEKVLIWYSWAMCGWAWVGIWIHISRQRTSLVLQTWPLQIYASLIYCDCYKPEPRILWTSNITLCTSISGTHIASHIVKSKFSIPTFNEYFLRFQPKPNKNNVSSSNTDFWFGESSAFNCEKFSNFWNSCLSIVWLWSKWWIFIFSLLKITTQP